MIIVFGSNVLDIFFHQADLPPKDTAIFLDCHDEASGGKGANQAVAAARAGSEVLFFGALGDGGHGRQMFKNLQRNNVDVSGIEFLDMPSGLATIFVDETDGTHKVVVSQGANLKARQSTISDRLLNEDTTILVQGELPMAETEALIIRAKQKGARTAMNFAPATKPLSETLLKNLDILILNEHEANLVGKSLGEPTRDKIAFAEILHDKFGVMAVITLGPEGSLICDGQNILKIPSLNIKPVDTIGAGDAHAAYFCAALDQGKPLEEALKWASAAGSLACTKVGAQTALPNKDAVMTHIDALEVTLRPLAKVTTLQQQA